MDKNSFKFSYKSSYQENLSLSIYNVGYQRCEPEYSWGPGIRDHYLLHYVKEGCGFLKTANEEFKVESGSIFLIKPAEVVYYVSDKDEPWEYYWVGFNGTEAHRLINLTPFSSGNRVIKIANENLSTLLMEIYNRRGNSSASEAKMLGFLYQFLGILMENSDKSSQKEIRTKSYLKQAIKYISYNFSNELSISDIAKAINISPSHLYRVFSTELDMSPINFLMKYRINESCSLLKYGNLSIGEVANSVGFTDPFYFSRVFKKIKGLSPREYIKLQK